MKKLLISLLVVPAIVAQVPEPQVREGEQLELGSLVVTTNELMGELQQAKKIRCSAPAGCNIPVPPAGPPVTVRNNHNSLGAVAFFPNAAAQNSTAKPPQTLAKVFLAGSPRINLTQFGTPPDTMGIPTEKQFLMAINNGIVSFDRETGKQDFALNVDATVFGNGAPNFEHIKLREKFLPN